MEQSKLQHKKKMRTSKIEFVRFGGLSKVDHKHAYRRSIVTKITTFHVPPVRKGIYAFIYPYIEDFLWAWKISDAKMGNFGRTPSRFKEEYKRLRKKFTYEGLIWTHFIEEARRYGLGNRYTEHWVEIHTDDLNFVLSKVKHVDIKQLFVSANIYHLKQIHDPYKRGLGGVMARDHLEVFIEKVN